MLLTVRQMQALQFIEHYSAETGRAPSFREIAVGIGAKSLSSVHRIVRCLIQRGYLAEYKRRARALEVIRRSDGRMTSDQLGQAAVIADHALRDAGASDAERRRCVQDILMLKVVQ